MLRFLEPPATRVQHTEWGEQHMQPDMGGKQLPSLPPSCTLSLLPGTDGQPGDGQPGDGQAQQHSPIQSLTA